VVPVMVQNLLLESLDNAGKLDVIGRGVVGVRADYALLTHVREFQAEYDEDGVPVVRVRLQARLVRLPRRTSVASTSEEFVVPAGGTSMPAIVRAFDEAFGKVDVLLTPTTPGPAFGIGEVAGDPIQMYLNDIFTVTVNMAGLPGIAVPAGLDGQGLPLGLQLIGRPFDEETLFAAAAVIEQAAGRFTPHAWW